MRFENVKYLHEISPQHGSNITMVLNKSYSAVFLTVVTVRDTVGCNHYNLF